MNHPLSTATTTATGESRVDCERCDFHWTGHVDEMGAVVEKHERTEPVTCPQAEKIAAKAREGFWKVSLNYATGETEYAYPDGSTRIVNESRVGLLIEDREDPVAMSVMWTLNHHTNRWNLMGKGEMIYNGKLYELPNVAYVTDMVRYPTYWDRVSATDKNAIGEHVPYGDEEE